MPAAVGHGGVAVAPTAAVFPASGTATGTAAVGTGARAGIMPAGASVGTRPGLGAGSGVGLRPGVSGAIFGAGWGMGRRTAGRLPRTPWAHTPGSGPRVLIGPDTHKYRSESKTETVRIEREEVQKEPRSNLLQAPLIFQLQ